MAWAITAAVAVTAYSADRQKSQAKKVDKEQKKLASTERAIAGERSARAKRQTMASAQVARAEQENAAAAGGTTGGSMAIQAGQDVTGQAAQNVAAINRTQDQANIIQAGKQNVVDAGRTGVGDTLTSMAGNAAAKFVMGSLGSAAGSAGTAEGSGK
jgi:hypothetical protein